MIRFREDFPSVLTWSKIFGSQVRHGQGKCCVICSCKEKGRNGRREICRDARAYVSTAFQNRPLPEKGIKLTPFFVIADTARFVVIQWVLDASFLEGFKVEDAFLDAKRIKTKREAGGVGHISFCRYRKT